MTVTTILIGLQQRKVSFPHYKHDINGVHPSEPADLKSVLDIIMEGLEE